MVIFHGYKSVASCHPQVESVNRGPKHQSHVLEEMEDVGAPATCQSPTYAHPESTHRNFVKRSTHTQIYYIIYIIYINLPPPKLAQTNILWQSTMAGKSRISHHFSGLAANLRRVETLRPLKKIPLDVSWDVCGGLLAAISAKELEYVIFCCIQMICMDTEFCVQ